MDLGTYPAASVTDGDGDACGRGGFDWRRRRGRGAHSPADHRHVTPAVEPRVSASLPAHDQGVSPSPSPPHPRPHTLTPTPTLTLTPTPTLTLTLALSPYRYLITTKVSPSASSPEDGPTHDGAAAASATEAFSILIGFRSVEVRKHQLLLNGKPLLIKGVNRHEHDPYTGHVVSRQSMLEDILAMKAMHINAVRCSHYMNDAYWLTLTDRYGLLVVDEANIESHGAGWGNASLARAPDWVLPHMERTVAMVERDKNHPSVILWSLGNEAGNGANFHQTFRWLKARDKSRPVQYERALQDANVTASEASPHTRAHSRTLHSACPPQRAP